MTFFNILAVIFGFLLVFIGGGCSILLAVQLVSGGNGEWVMMLQLLAVSVVTLGIGLLIVKWAKGAQKPKPPEA